MLLLRALSRISNENDVERAMSISLEELAESAKWKVLGLLLGRSWFHRTWVVQECAVPKEISVQCGYRDIPWTDLIEAVFLVARMKEKQLMPHCLSQVEISSVIELRKTRVRTAPRGGSINPNPDSLLKILARYRSREAGDLRDKVFALLRTWTRLSASQIHGGYRSNPSQL